MPAYLAIEYTLAYLRPRGSRERERVGGKIPAYGEDSILSVHALHGYAPEVNPVAWAAELFGGINRWNIPPTDRDSSAAATSGCLEWFDWYDIT